MTSASLGRRFAAEFRPRPVIYWTDLGASAVIGWGLLAVSTGSGVATIARVGASLGASIALLRAAYFIHELAHINRRTVPGFAVGWHLVAGIPLLIPSLMIGAHKHHHRVASYGTERDPEYASIQSWSRIRIAADLASMLIVPPALIVRWAVLGPLSWIVPPLRGLVVERMSTLAISPSYRRQLADGRSARFLAQEAMMAVFVWTAVLVIPHRLVAHWWVVTAVALLLNQVRTYVAHTYSDEPRAPTIDAQVGDTLTVGGYVFTELLAPLGDRFHAAHHRFPSLPYHCLGKVHARLLAELPPDDPYRANIKAGLGEALRERFIAARPRRRAQPDRSGRQ